MTLPAVTVNWVPFWCSLDLPVIEAILLFLFFSHPVMSDSLRPHGLQHGRPSCPSPSPRVGPSSCSLHQWCHPVISTSNALFSFCPQSFPVSGTFPVSIQSWSPFRLTGLIFLLSRGLSRVFPNTMVQRHQLFGILPSLWSSFHNSTWPLGRP